MKVEILSPIAGRRAEVSEMPDPVFATGLVGPGAAISPSAGEQPVVAPVAGILAKVHPHAFLIMSDPGPGVLVHLGIDTVQMNGDGFTVLVDQGSRVVAGQPIVRWDPTHVERSGRSPMCAVVILDCPFPAQALQDAGAYVDAATPLFTVEC